MRSLTAPHLNRQCFAYDAGKRGGRGGGRGGGGKALRLSKDRHELFRDTFLLLLFGEWGRGGGLEGSFTGCLADRVIAWLLG